MKFLYPKLNIYAKGRTPDPERAEAIKSMPVPNNVTKLRVFLGLANYYGMYIPNMQNPKTRLNNLLKKKWNGIRHRIVKKLSKKKLKNYFRFIFSLFRSETRNYSSIGREWLRNWCSNLAWYGKVHAWKTLPPAEKTYSQTEKERLAIIFAVNFSYRFEHGRKFVLRMDPHPLLSILGPKKGIPSYTANRLQRWGTI